MLPVSDFKIFDARELTLGHLAYLEAEETQVFVGATPNGEALAVFLDDWTKENLAFPEAINGFAVAISDVWFEADINSARRCETHAPTIGTLVSKGETLAVVANGKRGRPTFVLVANIKGDTGGYAVSFSDWRIVKRQGDENVTLFEMKG